MSVKKYENEVWPSLEPSSTITLLSPGDDDDSSDEDGDWSDIDDEDFEDMAEDKDDFHEMEIENNIFDPDDDDHLPEDDFE
jgi:hypothetical protein